jgi:hypothetical protein
MHQYVRAAIQRHADYHAAVAEYYGGKAANGGGEGHATPMPPPETPISGGRRRGTGGASTAAGPLPDGVPSAEALARLIEMHEGASKDLLALLADDPLQAIVRQRRSPPVARMPIPAGARSRGRVQVH